MIAFINYGQKQASLQINCYIIEMIAFINYGQKQASLQINCYISPDLFIFGLKCG